MVGRFIKDSFITFNTRILQLVLGLGSSVIIARVLGPGGVGVYSLAILLPAFLTLFTQLGVGSASVFFIGKKKYSLKEIFGTNIIFSVFISIFAILIGLIIISFFNSILFPNIEKEYLFLALSLIPFQLFLNFAVDILLGMQKIKKYNFIQLMHTLIFLFLITIFLLGFHFGIKAAIIAQTISIAIACIILFLTTKKETKGLSFSFNKNLFKDFLSYGSKIYLGNIATFLYTRINMWMINIFLSPLAVGFYSIAVKLSEQIWLISQAGGTILFPRVSSETDGKRLKDFTPLVCRNVLFITFLIALALSFLGHRIIILLYSEEYSASVLPFQILLIGSLAVSGSRILTNDLAGRGRPMINTYIAIITLVVNILLNIILIPQFGIIGVAWATVISYTSMLLLKTVIYSKISNNRIIDIIFIKKTDFKFYKNFLGMIMNKLKNKR
ncbi:MAG: flippase [Candidatus Paceibacterota bacterium]|jgi:O-antigen/teichoic acid export membrane protein